MLIVLFLIQVGLGVIKFVLNINILVTSFPITIIFGLLFTGLALAVLSEAMAHYFDQVFAFMQNLLLLQTPRP